MFRSDESTNSLIRYMVLGFVLLGGLFFMSSYVLGQEEEECKDTSVFANFTCVISGGISQVEQDLYGDYYRCVAGIERTLILKPSVTSINCDRGGSCSTTDVVEAQNQGIIPVIGYDATAKWRLFDLRDIPTDDFLTIYDRHEEKIDIGISEKIWIEYYGCTKIPDGQNNVVLILFDDSDTYIGELSSNNF